MKRVFVWALPLLFCCICIFASACSAPRGTPPGIDITPIPTKAATPAATAASTPEETPASAPAATPFPAPTAESTPAVQTATLGFVGDILIMSLQIAGAKTGDGYDFSRSFAEMEEVFSSVDFLCGNFECTLAGEDAGYSLPRQTPPPATEENPTPKAPFQRFNAPDELARDLFEAGFDLLSTANNHSMDKGAEGLYRTALRLREAGMLQVGTYTDAADALTPRVAAINGIKVGFVAAAGFLNSGVPSLSKEEKAYAIAMLSDTDLLAAQIAACREAGAEFVVAIVHWGAEHSNAESAAQRKAADALIEIGADAIIGAHPHVAQPMEWRAGERDGKPVAVPVAYSLGNFISNMAQPNVNYGVFARLTLVKSPSGEVKCEELAYLPLLCYRDGVHRVKPCFGDEAGASKKAFSHVVKICAGEGVALIKRGDASEYAGETPID